MQQKLNIHFKPDYSLNNYFKGACNSKAFNWIQKWPCKDEFKTNYHCTCIYGPKGSGKTHIASIWAEKNQAIFLNPTIDYLRLPRDFASESLNFVIDNADFCIHEEWFFHFYNALVEKNGCLLITASTPPNMWKVKLEDLRSRLSIFFSLELKQPDDEVLYMVFRKLLADQGVRLRNKTISFILKRIERSFSSLQHWSQIFAEEIHLHQNLNFSKISEILEKNQIQKPVIQTL